jgi:hypothetical protein
MIKFKVFYYSLVDDSVITKTIEADSMVDAWWKARDQKPKHTEESFDVYMDTLMVTSATIDDGLGNVKEIH